MTCAGKIVSLEAGRFTLGAGSLSWWVYAANRCRVVRGGAQKFEIDSCRVL